MNQFQNTARNEAIRRIKEKNRKLHETYDESPAKFRAVVGSMYPLHCEVTTAIPTRIPAELAIHNYSSFPIPENNSKMFVFRDKEAFDKFLNYLRGFKAQFKATILPPPQHPNNILRGF